MEFPGDLNQPGLDRPRPATLFDIVFAAIVLLASGFSGYTTYLGFSYDVPAALSATLAVIIGLSLVAINFRLRQERVNNGPVAGVLVAFMFIFIFSFISNTNAIYTYFVRGDIVEDTQEAAWRVFDAQTQRMLSLIRESEAVRLAEEQERRLAVARTNLREQITDPANPGLGALAREHLREVEEIIGTPLTPLSPPPEGATLVQYEAYVVRLDTLIETQASESITAPATPLRALQREITQLRELYGTATAERQYSSNTIDLMSRDLAGLSNEVSAELGREIEFEQINDSADKTGSFQYTWANFINWISPPAIILSVLLGALLDIIAPLLSLLLYRPNDDLSR